jgi:hypothetical protein
MLIPAPLETARFGLSVARASLDDDEVDAAALARQLIKHRIDVAILRIPARPSPGIAALHAIGLAPIHADTLVTYSCDLVQHPPQALLNPSLQIRPAEPVDAPGITALVETVFADYPNHYRANPLFPREDIVAGYGQWALSHIDAANRTCWLACVDGRIAGLACSAFDDRTGVCQGVLHAVSPDFARNRIYTDLIRFTQNTFRERGLKALTISTQVGNLRVQRVWVREGFTFESAMDTFHINALFGAIDAAAEPLSVRAPAEGEADAGWLSARALEIIGQGGTNGKMVGCRASLLTSLAPGATYRGRIGRTRPRAGLPGEHVVYVLSDAADDPVAWVSATCK